MKQNIIDREMKTSHYLKETVVVLNSIVRVANTLVHRVNILECKVEQILERKSSS
jgi:hypothetical protein